MPCRGQFAQSKQRRMQRWLNNPRINVHRIYGSLITAALANWQEEVMYLAFDTSLFWEEYCLIRLDLLGNKRETEGLHSKDFIISYQLSSIQIDLSEI